jgi:hypothetical protein
MPGFVRTPQDEARWSKAKESAGKQTAKDSESYWKLSNYIFHRMKKDEESTKFAKELEKSLTKVPNAMKMPKPKAMGKATDKPSLFFKKEDFGNIKRSSIENLRVFLENTRRGKQS